MVIFASSVWFVLVWLSSSTSTINYFLYFRFGFPMRLSSLSSFFIVVQLSVPFVNRHVYSFRFFLWSYRCDGACRVYLVTVILICWFVSCTGSFVVVDHVGFLKAGHQRLMRRSKRPLLGRMSCSSSVFSFFFCFCYRLLFRFFSLFLSFFSFNVTSFHGLCLKLLW